MNGDITFEPIKGWQTKLLLSTRRSNTHGAFFNSSEHHSHRVSAAASGKAGDATHRYDYSKTDLLEVTSNYRTTFAEKHRFDALVGYSWEKTTNEGFSAYNADFNNDTFKWNNIGIGQLLKDGKASMSGYKDDNTLIGFFGRISYGFDNRYNVLVSIRREGSSKFGATTSGVTSPQCLRAGTS